NTSSCVAHAVAGAIDVLETKAGLPYVPPSRLFLYFNARRYHSKSVTDSGTYIRTCIKGLLKAGVPDEKYWPFSTSKSKINRRPGWEPYMKAFSRRDGEYYAIRSSGSARIASIKAALSDGYPVAFGTPVAKSFLSSSGPHVVDKPSSADTIVGGHAMLIVGYKEDAGRVLFEVLNSWGTRYRDDGYVWLTDDYIKWRLTNDLTIIKGWKRLKNARRAA
ncbi:MAG: C1 family peptidase, partial [Proteobacteria bacterium]|nr:C1 family peptidase [Pseudomonadota bacterium]